MVAAGIGQIGLAAFGLPLLVLSGLITLLLIAPVMMLTSATPAVSIAADGITLHPRVWHERFVAWDDVRAIKDYPLLPPKDAEVTRRAMVGKKRYRAAEGKMLIIPSLPLQYRFTGIFAGEGFTGVVALTNRSHTDYDRLIKQVEKHVQPQPPDPLSIMRGGEKQGRVSIAKSVGARHVVHHDTKLRNRPSFESVFAACRQRLEAAG